MVDLIDLEVVSESLGALVVSSHLSQAYVGYRVPLVVVAIDDVWVAVVVEPEVTRDLLNREEGVQYFRVETGGRSCDCPLLLSSSVFNSIHGGESGCSTLEGVRISHIFSYSDLRFFNRASNF